MRYRFFFVAAFTQWLKMHGESRLYAHTLMFWWTQQQHHLSQTCNKSFIFILFNTCTTHKRQRHSIWDEKNTQKIFQPYASIRYASYLPRMLFPLYNLHHHRTSVCYHCTLIRVTFFFLPIWCCSQPMFLCSLLHSVQKSYIYCFILILSILISCNEKILSMIPDARGDINASFRSELNHHIFFCVAVSGFENQAIIYFPSEKRWKYDRNSWNRSLFDKRIRL